MLGLPMDDDEDEGAVRKRKRPDADDLDDDFEGGYAEEDEWDEVGKGLDDEVDEDEDTDEDSEEDEDEDSEADSGEEIEDLPKVALPYVFQCPSTHADLLSTLKNVPDEDVSTVIKRIRTLYHTSLGPDNKFKLQVTVKSRSLLFICLTSRRISSEYS